MTLGKLVDLYLAGRVTGRLRSAASTRAFSAAYSNLGGHARRGCSPARSFCIARGEGRSGRARSAGNARQLIGGLFTWAEKQDIVVTNPTKGLATFDWARRAIVCSTLTRSAHCGRGSKRFPPGVADALRVQFLIGVRIGEVGGMTVQEVDRDKWVWTLPAARSKNKRVRITPLVGLASSLRALAQISAASPRPHNADREVRLGSAGGDFRSGGVGWADCWQGRGGRGRQGGSAAAVQDGDAGRTIGAGCCVEQIVPG